MNSFANSHQRRVIAALLLGLGALVAAALAARGPAVREQVQLSWPPDELPAASPSRTWFTPMLLARHSPESLEARIPCGTEPTLRDSGRTIVVLATARRAGPWNALEIVRSTATGETLVRVGGSELTRIPAANQAARCTFDVAVDGTAWTVDGPGQRTRSGTLATPPRVFGLITELDLRAHPEIAVTIRPFSQDTRPSSRQTTLRVLAALLLGAAIVLLLSAGPRRRLRVPGRLNATRQDAVVGFVLTIWWLLAPLHYDDGWVRARQTNSLVSGGFSNYYEHWGSNLPLDTWFEWLQRFVVAHTSSLAADRLPSMLLLAATWWVCRMALAAHLGSTSNGREPTWWAAALTFSLGCVAFGNTLRPEPVVALLAVTVLASSLAYLKNPAMDLLVLGVLLCGLAITVHPAGVVAAAPLVVCLPRIVRDARARDPISFARLVAVSLIGGAWTLLLAFVDSDQRNRETDTELIRSTQGHAAGIFQELQRYGGLGETGGSPVRRLFAFLLLVAAVAGVVALLRRRRPLAASLPSASVALSLLFLSVTPSKWIWHFGALIGVGAVAIAFETLRLADMHVSTRARAAFAVAAVGVASIASIEANHAGPLDTARLDWSVTPAWYLLAVIGGGGGALVARQLGLTRRASLIALPAVLASVMGMTMLLLAADTAATSGWTTPRQAMSSLVGRDACGVASDLVVATPARGRIATPDAPTSSRQITAAGVSKRADAPVVLDAAGTTRWYEVGNAPIGLFIGGTWGPRQSLFVVWGRGNTSGVQRLRSGHADLRHSTEGPDFARWRFVTESSFPTRPSGANAVRFRLDRTSQHSSARITSPTTSVHLPLSRLLGRPDARSLVSPFLFEAMPCAALPSLADGLAEPPDFLVDFDPAPPLTAPTSPFVGLLEMFDLERLPVRSHVDRGSLFVYRTQIDSRDAVALPKKTVVS